MQLSSFVGLHTNELDYIKSKSLLVGLPTNANRTKNKSSLIGSPSNLDYTESESFSVNWCKNNGAKSKGVGGKEIKRDDSESLEWYRQAINNFQLIFNLPKKSNKIKQVCNW